MLTKTEIEVPVSRGRMIFEAVEAVLGVNGMTCRISDVVDLLDTRDVTSVVSLSARTGAEDTGDALDKAIGEFAAAARLVGAAVPVIVRTPD